MPTKENQLGSGSWESQKRISFEERIAKNELKKTICQQNKPIPSSEEIQRTPEEKQIFQQMRAFVKSSDFQEALQAYFEAFSRNGVNQLTFKPKIIDDPNYSKKYPCGNIAVFLPLRYEPINNELHPSVLHELIIFISYGSLYGLGNKLENKFIINYKSQEFADFESLLNQMAEDVYNERKKSAAQQSTP